MYTYGLPRWCSGKKSACQCKRLVRSLGQKDPLEKEMVTHSSILAWKIPWTEESGGLQSKGSQESLGYVRAHTHIYVADSLCCTGKTNTTL